MAFQGMLCLPNDPRLEIHNAEKIISVIARIELQAKRGLSPEEIAKRKSFTEAVTVIPLKTDVEEEAIRLRQFTSLKLPDASTHNTKNNDIPALPIVSGDHHAVPLRLRIEVARLMR
jgi:hypothetical protein